MQKSKIMSEEVKNSKTTVERDSKAKQTKMHAQKKKSKK
jgi:hypothetical protein